MPATVLSLPNTAAPSREATPAAQPATRHTYFDERPSWDNFGLSLFTETLPSGDEWVLAAQGLVLPNKVNLRQKTQATLFPIELGGIETDRNFLSNWSGPNYAIPLRALSSRTMAQQPTFNHSGWERRRVPKQGLMARFEVVRREDGSINHLHIYAWAVDITTGQPTEAQTGTEWKIPNRY